MWTEEWSIHISNKYSASFMFTYSKDPFDLILYLFQNHFDLSNLQHPDKQLCSNKMNAIYINIKKLPNLEWFVTLKHNVVLYERKTPSYFCYMLHNFFHKLNVCFNCLLFFYRSNKSDPQQFSRSITSSFTISKFPLF